MRTTILSLVVGALPFALDAHATDFNISPGQSIQAAIDLAVDGDRVLVQPGTYFGQIDFGTKAIEVVGTGGPLATYLDGNATGPVVRFGQGAGPDSVLRGVTVQHGAATTGAGGIQCSASTPTITDCVVRDNSGKFGGGISGNPVLERCVVRGNFASLTHGGGIYGAPQIHECLIADNRCTSAEGGGIYFKGASASISDSFVVSNGIQLGDPAKGAGISMDGIVVVTIENTVIANNLGQGNVFGAFGGGVWANSHTTIDRCTIVGNTLMVNNVQGPGVYGAAVITNSIVRGNTPGAPFAGSPTVTWSNVEGGYAGAGNIDIGAGFVDPYFAQDHHLLSSSRCIDAGDPAAFDPDGSRVDMGAFPFETLYASENTELFTWDLPSWSSLSLAAGGRQLRRLELGPAHAGHAYALIGSATGTAPGIAVGSLTLPLAYDAYSNATLFAPSSVGLSGSFGLLDTNGRAECRTTVPSGAAPNMAGVTLWHAAVVIDPVSFAVSATTNALALELVP